MRVAVVGHVEWVEFARVPVVPRAGEIVHAAAMWTEAGGGGAVAAVQLARLAGAASFFTALGDDEIGRLAAARLEQLGVDLHVAWRDEPMRRAFVHLDSVGERTITVLGDRLVPRGDDALPWETLADADAVYFTGGDVEALRHARAAGALVATPRARETLLTGGVQLDALVGSDRDPGEHLDASALQPPPRVHVATEGPHGGHYTTAGGATGRWTAAPLPGPVADAYGCGDSFAAGLAFALGSHQGLPDALDFAARCGAACLTYTGPYGPWLREVRPP
jgi:ribokinase